MSRPNTASIHDEDYRQLMRLCNMYIEQDDPPMAFIQQANRIISRSLDSPEIDEAAIHAFKSKSRRLQDDAKDEIVQQTAPYIVQATNEVLNSRIARDANQPWSDSVPVPFEQHELTIPLLPPKPIPDLAFGFLEDTFTHKQLRTIDLLVDDRSGRSYAVPDKKLRFPFLTIEFMSQAENKIHCFATNQVAGAGAIALNDQLELAQRSFGHKIYDCDEPQFFSVTMDHRLACINVH